MLKSSRRALFSIWAAFLVLGGQLIGMGCALAADAQPVNTTRKLRIAAIYFVHETVTFLPYDTTREDFIYEGSPARGEALLGSDPKERSADS